MTPAFLKTWPLALAGLLACTADTPTSPDIAFRTVAPSSSASGCYAVDATWTGTPSGPTSFTGVLSGDLEGTLRIDFTGSLRFAGVTLKNGGTAQWQITGGVLPTPLVFQTEFDNKNLVVDRPGSPELVFENIGSHHATSGVASALLHYDGSFAVVPSLEANHTYHGVICP